ncbi:hypothetical protein WICANDRAFT_64391 [Wickerhamomyces anomalus NRRL Y-366-8]|uniref:Stationary phase protein 5 n=1 Tax=Wickerhamomyces anomalus (strain ATCC 58044 / CBS 1984 / NCYC 433 / NRRL Y-366-8) TaxID=683960 RepID=A0A1E3NZY6_WICAA|nr:uncharacterized protein WICANDRAFT_64391 [Wickerhamomyces anomalus NRRL Y-366-8]ODQ58252.1 hypothetical protein WICANDRAFT_64391 [Wickerhamomyces anomalus NRRL Y-366-8]
MVANRLRNLVSLTRGAVRDARQVLDELINSLGPRPQPALVRVPIRNQRGPRFPVPNKRHFSTATAFRSASTINSFKQPKFFKPIKGGNIAGKLWPYSAFRRPAIGKGPFPSGLYRNFVNLNSRNFSTFGGSASREAVQNLTANLRCFLNNGGDIIINTKMTKTPSQHMTYHGCVSQSEAPQTFALARTESTNVSSVGSFVEFTFPKLRLSIPTMSFINSEIIGSIQNDLDLIKEQIDEISKQVQVISDSYGSLPLERRKDSIRIHFPNSDTEDVERLLIELGVNKGIVYSNEVNDVPEMSRDSSSYGSLTDDDLTSLSDMVENAIPDLISTGSETSTVESREFLPILSSSEELKTHSESGESLYFTDGASPVIITYPHTFSEISV